MVRGEQQKMICACNTNITEWLMVAITAIYVIATILICIFNSKSAKSAKEQTEATKKQIEENIKQYNEMNRPVISVRFEVIRSGLMCFIVENVGVKPAFNVKLQLNKEFIYNINSIDKDIRINEISAASYYLSQQQRIFIFLGGVMTFDEIAKEVAKFDISYNDSLYKEHFEIDINQYRYILNYNSELEDIAHHLKDIKEKNKSFYQNCEKILSTKKTVDVIVHEIDDSDIFKVFKAVCLYPNKNAIELAEILGKPAEELLPVLTELEMVDKLVKSENWQGHELAARWCRR